MPELEDELLLDVELLEELLEDEEELLLEDELLLDDELLDDDPLPLPLPPQPISVRELNASAIPAKRVRDLLLVILCFPRGPNQTKSPVWRLAMNDVNEIIPTISYYDIPLDYRMSSIYGWSAQIRGLVIGIRSGGQVWFNMRAAAGVTSALLWSRFNHTHWQSTKAEVAVRGALPGRILAVRLEP